MANPSLSGHGGVDGGHGGRLVLGVLQDVEVGRPDHAVVVVVLLGVEPGSRSRLLENAEEMIQDEMPDILSCCLWEMCHL